jgi:hypothetical protein
MPGHEADQSPPSSSEVKNGWSLRLVPPVWLHGMDRDNFTSFISTILYVLPHFFPFAKCRDGHSLLRGPG